MVSFWKVVKNKDLMSYQHVIISWQYYLFVTFFTFHLRKFFAQFNLQKKHRMIFWVISWIQYKENRQMKNMILDCVDMKLYSYWFKSKYSVRHCVRQWDKRHLFVHCILLFSIQHKIKAFKEYELLYYVMIQTTYVTYLSVTLAH